MLLPKEIPYIQGLNSFYLHLEKFIEHMQGEIGGGGVYCLSPRFEMMMYFNEHEVISTLVQEKGKVANHTLSLEIARSCFYGSSSVVRVYQLDAHAIYFWAQMPPFQRASASLQSMDIPLPDLIFRLRQKEFSGFIDVQIMNKQDGGILFFHKGNRIGGSYTWGKGGMSTVDEDYNSLLGRVQLNEGVFSFGSFLKN